MGEHTKSTRHIIAYDGREWPGIDGGMVRPTTFLRVQEIVAKLEKDYGLIVTEDNPLSFDLGPWDFIELPT